MIECNILERDIEGMAFETVLAKLSVVYVSMTGDAATVVQQKGPGLFSGRRIIGTVALLTSFNFEVKTNERVAGLAMVERADVEENEIHIDSLMLWMTGPAIAVLLPMKSLGGTDSFGYFLVAGEAFFVCNTLPGSVT